MLKQDSDRDALVGSIPKLRQTLLWFASTLRDIEAKVHNCASCGNQATMCVRDEAHEEFFLCDSETCANEAQPDEL